MRKIAITQVRSQPIENINSIEDVLFYIEFKAELSQPSNETGFTSYSLHFSFETIEKAILLYNKMLFEWEMPEDIVGIQGNRVIIFPVNKPGGPGVDTGIDRVERTIIRINFVKKEYAKQFHIFAIPAMNNINKLDSRFPLMEFRDDKYANKKYVCFSRQSLLHPDYSLENRFIPAITRLTNKMISQYFLLKHLYSSDIWLTELINMIASYLVIPSHLFKIGKQFSLFNQTIQLSEKNKKINCRVEYSFNRQISILGIFQPDFHLICSNLEDARILYERMKKNIYLANTCTRLNDNEVTIESVQSSTQLDSEFGGYLFVKEGIRMIGISFCDAADVNHFLDFVNFDAQIKAKQDKFVVHEINFKFSQYNTISFDPKFLQERKGKMTEKSELIQTEINEIVTEIHLIIKRLQDGLEITRNTIIHSSSIWTSNDAIMECKRINAVIASFEHLITCTEERKHDGIPFHQIVMEWFKLSKLEFTGNKTIKQLIYGNRDGIMQKETNDSKEILALVEKFGKKHALIQKGHGL